ncbi:MAG TPA: isocitrate/isopropylmalate dehydrogenase family protein [Thermohalobaculum sp.]|nr:isocitrate/isopropylmalate dehydrogenase family protein [Thermohalobaculum sp.]
MKLLVLPGDGIGPEITAAAMQVLTALNDAQDLRLTFEHDTVGLDSLAKHGTTLRPDLIARFPGYDGIILGPCDTAAYPAVEQGGINISAFMRTKLDLYANIRPARTPSGAARPFDLIIVREVTEGYYADRNMHEGVADLLATPDVAISLRKVTRQASERIARRAFELAMTRDRRVTAIHKANVMKRSDGLFLEAVRTVARDFPEVTLDDVLVDAMAAWLVRAPERFDVVVAGNLYGDILSDLASELSGSLGLAGSIMAGDTLCAAQAQHGSAPDIAGHDKANPASMILSVAMLLEWLGAHHARSDLTAAGRTMITALDALLANPATRTADLGGKLGTAAFGDVVVQAVLAQKAGS